MLSLGHDFPFGFRDVPETERLRAVRSAGFDAVMIHWQEEDGLDACRRYDLVTGLGLNILTAHFPQERTADLWREGPEGDDLEALLVRSLREAAERGIRHMVVHTTRRLSTPPPSPVGLARFARAAEAAERYGIDLAVENTRFLRYNRYLFDHIPSLRLRFCYDCGHAACFTPDEDPLAMFEDRLVTTHLHDNHGQRDEHLLIGEGTVDLKRVFCRLAALGTEEYNLESRYLPLPGQRAWGLEEYLQTAFARLREHVDRAKKDFCVRSGAEDNDPS